MFSIEIWGLILTICGLIASVAAAVYPPRDANRRYFHGFYIASLLVLSALFGMLLQHKTSELEEVRAHIAERDKMSSQARDLLAAMNSSNRTCQGDILTSFAFLDKWKIEIPDTLQVAKLIIDRAFEPTKPGRRDRQTQVDDCRGDAAAMEQLLTGLAAR